MFDKKDNDKISFFSEKNKFFNVNVIKFLFKEIFFERDEINKFWFNFFISFGFELDEIVMWLK